MKDTIKFFGIIAFVAVFGFSMAACGGDDNGGNDGPASLGEDPTLSGKVYVLVYDDKGTAVYTGYNKGKLTVSEGGLEEKGEITNGQFSFKLGTPQDLITFNKDNLEGEFLRGYRDITISPNDAKGYGFYFFDIDNSDDYWGLCRELETGNESNGTYESVTYVYVDKDVTISGKGNTDIETWTDEGVTYIGTYITKDFNAAFKAGWNTVYSKSVSSSRATTWTVTETMSLGNPSNLRWALNGGGGGQPEPEYEDETQW
jgi:hypothetical protein